MGFRLLVFIKNKFITNLFKVCPIRAKVMDALKKYK